MTPSLRFRLLTSIGALALLMVTSCSEKSAPPPADQPVAANASAPSRPEIVAFGDSLTAGLGLEKDEAFPAQLQKHLDEANLQYLVVNAGVSGETSAGAVRRVDWVLGPNVKVLIVAFGGNDGLRG